MAGKWNIIIGTLFLVALGYCVESEGEKISNDTLKKPSAITTETSVTPLSFETDKNGQWLHMDFTLTPKPVSNPDLLFSHFANRNLIIFYFSVKCPHCQKVLPHIQNLADELEPYGISTLTIAVKNNTEDDVRSFIRKYNLTLPVFHDYKKSFSSLYGTGRIPLIIVVNHEGKYLRIKEFDKQKTPGQIKTVFSASASR